MFLKKIEKRNPKLLEAAINLHQGGEILANTYLLDIDQIKLNAKILADKANKLNLRTYYMTKQISRNPIAVKAALESGIDSTVAVSAMGAKVLHKHGLPVGHVGHLSQIPRHEIKHIIPMKPEIWTIYSVQMAKWISEEALMQGYRQDIIIKIADEGNMFLPGQDSGIWIKDLAEVLKKLKTFTGIRVIGVTAFPCVTYDVWGTEGTKVTPNFDALHRAKRMIEEAGELCEVINTPGNTSTSQLDLFHKHGSTCVEPGHGLTGTTPAHIYDDLEEVPAICYVSEISHHFDEYAYAYGGGLYVCIAGGPMGYPVKALVGADSQRMHRVAWNQISRDNIDYYAMLSPKEVCTVGDTVVFGFRPQAFVTRGYTAAVSGISSGKPVVEGIFDAMGHKVDI